LQVDNNFEVFVWDDSGVNEGSIFAL